MKSFINLCDGILRPFERYLGYGAGALMLLLMAMGVAEVIGRSFFNKPIHGNLDIIEQLMVPVAALGIAYCQSVFGNVRMTLVTQRFTGRRKWIAEAFALIIASTVVAIYVSGSYQNLMRSLTLGGDTPEIGIPLWYGIACVTFALGVLFLRLLLQFLEAVRLIAAPQDHSDIFEPVEN
ncbi:MAG: TRAP transporter small permease [Rhodobacteraceae bacterium]|nr:TRAP transporter small permease [Paracoccaceae bacterium]